MLKKKLIIISYLDRNQKDKFRYALTYWYNKDMAFIKLITLFIQDSNLDNILLYFYVFSRSYLYFFCPENVYFLSPTVKNFNAFCSIGRMKLEFFVQKMKRRKKPFIYVKSSILPLTKAFWDICSNPTWNWPPNMTRFLHEWFLKIEVKT